MIIILIQSQETLIDIISHTRIKKVKTHRYMYTYMAECRLANIIISTLYQLIANGVSGKKLL